MKTYDAQFFGFQRSHKDVTNFVTEFIKEEEDEIIDYLFGDNADPHRVGVKFTLSIEVSDWLSESVTESSHFTMVLKKCDCPINHCECEVASIEEGV